MNIKKYKKGEIIIQEGTKGQEMYFISSGKVNVFKMINEEKVELQTLGQDDFFGEMSLVLEDQRTASVEALEDTEVKGFSKETFLDLVRDNPDVSLEIIEKLTKRLKHAHTIISRIEGEKKGIEIIYGKH